MGEAEDEQAHDAPEPDPRTKLMQEVAEQMDAIEAEFGDGYEIGRIITVVEVIGPDGGVELRVRAGQYPWVALGTLQVRRENRGVSATGCWGLAKPSATPSEV